MPNNDDYKQAEKLFPGDRRRQDAYLHALADKPAPSTTKTAPSTKRKKKAAKTAPPPRRRRM